MLCASFARFADRVWDNVWIVFRSFPLRSFCLFRSVALTARFHEGAGRGDLPGNPSTGRPHSLAFREGRQTETEQQNTKKRP